MKTINLVQGTPEWHAHRAQHLNSSEAPIMLGTFPSLSRSELLKVRATGIEREITWFLQKIFDDGHRFEALARPLAEEVVGEDLYPCVGVLEGTRFSASFDGLNLMGDTAFEHKTLNATLREVMVEGCTGADLPIYHQLQMEQQCMVSGADRVLFMASVWEDDRLVEERHCWYTPNPELRARIIAGWEQFEADVAAYVHSPEPAPQPTGRAPETLPALRVEVTGMVTASNLAEFKASAMQVLESINRDLQTDDDFANAEETVKWCKAVEERLAATKDAVLAQTADIETVFRTMDEVSAETRRIRLELDKLVKAEKENRKAEIVAKARAAYQEHEAGLRAETKDVWITLPAPDFAGAIKGKRTLSSMADAVDTVLANAKIAANESAAHIRAALACLTEEVGDHKHLFPDYRDFIAKPVEDIRALVRGRIAEHKQREAEKLEIERQRIRQEEAERVERERVAAEIAAQKEAQASQQQENPATAPESKREQGATAQIPTTSRGARIKLGDINAALAPLSITADGLAQLGFNPVGQQRAAKLYAAADFPRMCAAIALRVSEAASRLDLPEAA